MATAHDTKIPLTSPDVNAERVARLRELFPEAFTEGKLDPAKLSLLFGDGVTDAAERYGLSWTGKSEAIKNIQTLTTGTLLPAPDESVNFDATENLIIEGDNLEVLKLMQGGYHGRVKMIYIDPPYNTGGDFIYPDNYKEGLADYLKFSGQVSGEGVKLTTNPETDGRYHSKWLTMIYPRLFLARNLLREDGVIFVSIDDHEVHNLRAVMNEIFGEENFVAEFIWKRRKQVDSRTKTGVSIDHEYCLCFRKSDFGVLRGQEIDITKYKNANNDPLGPWASDNLVGLATKDQRPNLHYDLVNPATKKVYSCPPTGWRYSRETMSKLISEGRILWPEKDTGRPRYKRYLSDLSDLFTGQSSILKTAFSADGTNELKELFSNMDVLDFPKPVAYLKLLFNQICKEDDIVLDFFAGSGTTAQAVLELNAQDGGNRKFILVQLPEPTERKDFPTIADITKERARRVIKKLNDADHGKLPMDQKPDRGFKVFKLSSSNFKVWDSTSAPKDAAGLAEQLKLMAHNVEEGRPDEALLYELILKSNLPLTSKITSGKIGKQTFYDVADGTLAICLERKVTKETLRGIIARKPKGVICLDVAFAGNDQLKTNIVLEMKSHGIEFHTA